MSEKNDNRIYIHMMEDSLKKKRNLLSILYDQTKEQEQLLVVDGDMDVDRFEKLLEEKGNGIEELNRIDDGFDSLYKKVESELLANGDEYQAEIEQMKELIREVTGLGTQIQALEKKNHERFGRYISSEREKLRAANKSQQTVQIYAQNMAGRHKPGNSYFVNEKK